MKKLVWIGLSLLGLGIGYAQSITDALRYGTQNISGTARFSAMSGAFGALGGDVSAMQINPAGSAVFTDSFGAITLSSSQLTNSGEYNATLNSNRNSFWDLNQLGAVLVYNTQDSESAIRKITLGLAYDKTANHIEAYSINGSSTTSIDNFFLNDAQGIPLHLITPNGNETIDDLYTFLGETEGSRVQQTFLAHEAFLIEANDLDDPNASVYGSNIAAGNFSQEYQFRSTGRNGKLSINAGMQLQERFFLGVALNSHFINYDETKIFLEQNSNPGSTINEVRYTTELSTRGNGFSAQIGGIVKASEYLRFGIALESPTLYFITEETTERLATQSATDGSFSVDPNVVNVFPEYELRTPAKATGSIAVVFGTRGLINLDYSYKDYRTLEFSGSIDDTDLDFNFQNTAIDNALQGTSSLRLGGEWRVSRWSFRGGLRYEDSPYKDDRMASATSGFSLGGGYNFGSIKIDVGYDYTHQERTEVFYPNSGFPNAAKIGRYANNLVFTLGIQL